MEKKGDSENLGNGAKQRYFRLFAIRKCIRPLYQRKRFNRMKDMIATFSKFGDAGHGGITQYTLSPAAIQARKEISKRMEKDWSNY
jgi:hypothetical protein